MTPAERAAEKAREALAAFTQQAARLKELGPVEYVRDAFGLPTAEARQVGTRRARIQRLRDREARAWAKQDAAERQQRKQDADVESAMFKARLERGRAIFPGE